MSMIEAYLSGKVSSEDLRRRARAIKARAAKVSKDCSDCGLPTHESKLDRDGLCPACSYLDKFNHLSSLLS